MTARRRLGHATMLGALTLTAVMGFPAPAATVSLVAAPAQPFTVAVVLDEAIGGLATGFNGHITFDPTLLELIGRPSPSAFAALFPNALFHRVNPNTAGHTYILDLMPARDAAGNPVAGKVDISFTATFPSSGPTPGDPATASTSTALFGIEFSALETIGTTALDLQVADVGGLPFAGTVQGTTVDLSAVPLPAAAWLFLGALASVPLARKRGTTRTGASSKRPPVQPGKTAASNSRGE